MSARRPKSSGLVGVSRAYWERLANRSRVWGASRATINWSDTRTSAQSEARWCCSPHAHTMGCSADDDRAAMFLELVLEAHRHQCTGAGIARRWNPLDHQRAAAERPFDFDLVPVPSRILIGRDGHLASVQAEPGERHDTHGVSNSRTVRW